MLHLYYRMKSNEIEINQKKIRSRLTSTVMTKSHVAISGIYSHANDCLTTLLAPTRLPTKTPAVANE